jgi:hypothetical protein
MRKTFLTLSLAAALAVPALANGHSTAGSNQPTGPARQACKAERESDPAAFQEKYANKNGKHAMGRCVRQRVRQAVKSCRAERKEDKDAFRERYGNEKGRHAFRRCVRQREGEMSEGLPAS